MPGPLLCMRPAIHSTHLSTYPPPLHVQSKNADSNNQRSSDAAGSWPLVPNNLIPPCMYNGRMQTIEDCRQQQPEEQCCCSKPAGGVKHRRPRHTAPPFHRFLVQCTTKTHKEANPTSSTSTYIHEVCFDCLLLMVHTRMPIPIDSSTARHCCRRWCSFSA